MPFSVHKWNLENRENYGLLYTPIRKKARNNCHKRPSTITVLTRHSFSTRVPGEADALRPWGPGWGLGQLRATAWSHPSYVPIVRALNSLQRVMQISPLSISAMMCKGGRQMERR